MLHTLGKGIFFYILFPIREQFETTLNTKSTFMWTFLYCNFLIKNNLKLLKQETHLRCILDVRENYEQKKPTKNTFWK